MELACSIKKTIFFSPRASFMHVVLFIINELGEGIAVDFPFKLKTSPTYSKKRFMSCSGQIKLEPNFPVEKVVLYFNRIACNSTKI